MSGSVHKPNCLITSCFKLQFGQCQASSAPNISAFVYNCQRNPVALFPTYMYSTITYFCPCPVYRIPHGLRRTTYMRTFITMYVSNISNKRNRNAKHYAYIETLLQSYGSTLLCGHFYLLYAGMFFHWITIIGNRTTTKILVNSN